MQAAVLGAGSWGTALAHVLALGGEATVLWGRDRALMEEMAQCRENRRYLPGWSMAAAVRPTADMAAALHDAALVVLAIPCQRLAEFLREHATLFPEGAVVVCASKGVEQGSLRTMGQVVAAELGARRRYAVLSGPSFAAGVMAGQPTAVVLGCADTSLGEGIQKRFSSALFRVYGTLDVLGVELAGALKNVMAIAAGLADGLGFGANARAALITRGLAEMARLGEAMGARAQTFMGLAGLGDLVLTCTGDESRNRRVGLAVGRGQTLEAALTQVGGTAEGVWTTQAVWTLAQRLGVEMPICEQVHAVLFSGKSPADAVEALMRRPLRWEA